MVEPKTRSRPAPFAAGRLAQRPLAHLLVYVMDKRLTGSFELRTEGGEEVRIAVRDGRIWRVATTGPVAYLGHILYESGIIDSAQLSESLAELASSQRLHGQILLAKGLITREQLSEALRSQRMRKLHHAFELPPQTNFEFYPGIDLVGERPDDVLPTDPLATIWRGVLANPPWDHVRSTLQTVADRPLRIAGSVEPIDLDRAEREAVERLRRSQMSAAQFTRVSGLEPRAAELLVYFLVITKTAELGHRPETTAPPSMRAPGSSPNPQGPPPQSPGKSAGSGEHTRSLSFTMRAVRTDNRPLSIPSPMAPVSPSTAPPVPPPPSSARDVTASSPPRPANLDAEHALSQAEMHLVLGNRPQAISAARDALSKEPGMPEAQALLAYLKVLGPEAESEQNVQESLRMVNAALRAKDNCKKGHYYRAEIKRLIDDHEGAIADLRTAVAQDPNDVDARRELRVYEQHLKDGTIEIGLGSSGSHKKAKGLFDRWRKK